MALAITKRFFDEESFLEIIKEERMREFLKNNEEVSRKFLERLNTMMEDSHREVLEMKLEENEYFFPIQAQKERYDEKEEYNKNFILEEIEKEYEEYKKRKEETAKNTKEKELSEEEQYFQYTQLGEPERVELTEIDREKVEDANLVKISDEVARFKEFARERFKPELGIEQCIFNQPKDIDETYFRFHLSSSLRQEKLSDLVAMINNLREKQNYALLVLESNKTKLIEQIHKINEQNKEIENLAKAIGDELNYEEREINEAVNEIVKLERENAEIEKLNEDIKNAIAEETDFEDNNLEENNPEENSEETNLEENNTEVVSQEEILATLEQNPEKEENIQDILDNIDKQEAELQPIFEKFQRENEVNNAEEINKNENEDDLDDKNIRRM